MSGADPIAVKVSSLKKRADFLRLSKSGQKWVSKTMVVQVAPSQIGQNDGEHIMRAGYTVTKKTYKSAVKRNRIKRRFRALACEYLPRFGRAGHDYVFIGRQDALDVSFDRLQKDFVWCLKRLGKL